MSKCKDESITSCHCCTKMSTLLNSPMRLRKSTVSQEDDQSMIRGSWLFVSMDVQWGMLDTLITMICCCRPV